MKAGEVDEKSAETSIKRQVDDILGITGQNEVIQSFVRSDLSNDSEEAQKDGNAKSTGKEKKGSRSRSKRKVNDTTNNSSGSGSGNGNSNSNKNNLIVPSTTSTHTAEKSGRNQRDDVHGTGSSSKAVVQFYPSLGKDAQTASDLGNKKPAAGWNRRQRPFEEVYTDKDRAAAVNLGSRDIKQSLKLKRRQDRTRILEISEETHPGTLLALAVHRYKNGDVYVAMKFVTKVQFLRPLSLSLLFATIRLYLVRFRIVLITASTCIYLPITLSRYHPRRSKTMIYQKYE